MIPTDRFPIVEVRSVAELRRWLARHHGQASSVWLATWTRDIPERYVSRWDVLDELLCFGWIDGIRRRLDEERTLQLISPRRQQAWSQTYRERFERLEREGRMAGPGRAAARLSQERGLWEALPDVDALLIPADVCAALDAPGAGEARAFFESTAPSYRRNVLRWIAKAVRPETRARRIAELAAHARERRRIPQM